MKILFVTPAYYPAVRWGGPIVSVHLLARGLRARSHEVQVLTTTFDLKKNEDTREFIDGVCVFYCRSFSIGRWLISFSLLRRFFQTAPSFDLVHISSVWDPVSFLSALLARLRSVPIIISPRGSLDENLIKGKSYLLKLLVYYCFLRPVLASSRAIHCTSVFEQQRLESYTGITGSCFIVPNPIDIDSFSRPPASFSFLQELGLIAQGYVLYLGRINWKKGLPELISGFELFLRSRPRAGLASLRLVIAGPDEDGYLQTVRSAVSAAGIGDRVVFTGLVEGDRKSQLLFGAYAFVLTSHSENFGIAVAEAMACGVPVLISKDVGISDLVSRYRAGAVSTSLSPSSIAASFSEIFSGDRDAYAAAGRRLVAEQFTVDSVAHAMEAVYRRIISSTNST